MKKLQLLLSGMIPAFIACSQSIGLSVVNTINYYKYLPVNPYPVQPVPLVLKPSSISYNIVECEDCRDGRFTLNAPIPPIFSTPNSLTFTQPVTISTIPTKTIKNIQAGLVYFEMIPDNDLCFPCNKDDLLYGHFSNGTNSQQWEGPQSNLNISISTPLTPCCGTTFRWCIRYRVEFTDCTVCSRLICYETRKEGCSSPDGVVTDAANRIIKSN